KHPFEPLLTPFSQFLVLGTFPSIKSFENNFYYAHPRNQFWKILASIFDTKLETTEMKRQFCETKKIALWDVFAQAQRSSNNSSDTNLKETRVNDISKLVQEYPHIKELFFTSKKAYNVFQKHFHDFPLKQTLLPSPSPAYALLSFEKKVEIYKKDFYSTVSNV
ncbi:MAG: DNA-deoxyinosine glycosylase, partial [Thiovulaceae bacterium]|nr:DNA-deoxyinosine glycosylase [Sulfurimonadaceae bacterium]